MSHACSIVMPVHNRAGLTRQCIDAIIDEPPMVSFEIVVVDDASTDWTARLLAQYGDAVRVLTRFANGGFATACNDGAAATAGTYLIFLNNDTIPRPGWLDALVDYAERHPGAAVVGSKLLFPDDSIQHAGVVVCQDGNPRHLYAGFPGDHLAVNTSRQFQAVTAACVLVRRDAFDQVGGFDTAFRNCLEDVDLCLRLRERGHEVHYCHESVLYHLESVSRGRRSKEIERNAKLFRSRWGDRARRDDLDYYLADGLVRVRYRDSYPIGIEISPQLAILLSEERKEELERLLETQSRHVTDLLRETVRLSAQVADLELGGGPAASSDQADRPDSGRAQGRAISQKQFLRRVELIELEIYELQADLAAALSDNGSSIPRDARPDDARGFEPSAQLGYRKLLAEIRRSVTDVLPANATVLVVSRGDDDLLQLDGRPGWHFPQDEDGTYAGYYPPDSAAAIAHLEALRKKGADYLLVPSTAFWWLERYSDFGLHLKTRYAVAAEDENCLIFTLQIS
jgi:GT2 family glycosyltransferase